MKQDIKKYKEGDDVVFEQCWEDESGQYHDEVATIVHIHANGKLELEWQVDSPDVKDFLEENDWTVEDLP